MSATDEILAGIDSRQLAAALGTDEATAMHAAAAAIPTLIGGLQANSASSQGEVSLLQALGQHADSGYGDTIDLDQVDTADGQKIVAHTLAGDYREAGVPARLARCMAARCSASLLR